MILKYEKYLYYIPTIYLIFILIRWLDDNNLYFPTWYPFLITFSFVIIGVIFMIIKYHFLTRHKKEECNTKNQLLFFLATWLFFIYDFPFFIHKINHKEMKVNAEVSKFKTYMAGGKYSYKRHYKVIINSTNDQFNNREIKALDNAKYYYLREKDRITLIGDISPFMFRLKKLVTVP